MDTVSITDVKGNTLETATNKQGIWTRVNGIVTDMGVPIKINGIILQPKLFPYLYCLNDIHRASGYGQSQRPSNWLKSPQCKALHVALDEYTLDTMERMDPSLDMDPYEHVRSIKGGPDRGTYGSILIVLDYAAYLCKAFQIEVYSSYLRNSVVVDAESAIVLDEQYVSDNFVTSTGGDISIGNFSKVLQSSGASIKPQALFTLLREQGFLMKGVDAEDPDHNIPYQKYLNDKFFTVKRVLTKNRVYLQPRVTPHGVTYLTPIIHYLVNR